MQELTGRMKQELADIRERYDLGKLDAATVAGLAEAAIDAELEKPDEEINGAWMDACADLIAYVNREKLTAPLKDAWPTIRGRIREQKSAEWRRSSVRVAACIALVLGISAALPMLGLWGAQAPDGPTGRESILVTEAKAEDTPTPPLSAYETADFADVCAFLGAVPPMPARMPEGWRASLYRAEKGADGWHFRAQYAKAGEEAPLLYEVEWFADAGSLRAPWNGEGETVTLENGWQVYLTATGGQVRAAWTAGNWIMHLSGPATREELLQSISGIQ